MIIHEQLEKFKNWIRCEWPLEIFDMDTVGWKIMLRVTSNLTSTRILGVSAYIVENITDGVMVFPSCCSLALC